MKKGFVMVSLVFAMLLVSGCGKKDVERTLTCTSGDFNEIGVLNDDVKVNFLNDKGVNAEVTMKMTITDDKTDANDFYTSFDSNFTDLKDQAGVTYNSSINDTEINANIVVDFANASDETLEKLSMKEITGTYDAAKTALESQSYICE